MTPQTMDTAPKDGGWVLGLVQPDGPTKNNWQTWEIVTWGDSGWVNDAGDESAPQAWVPLPDPQPRPTGWMPPEGTIRMVEVSGDGWTANGKPVEVSWRWMIDIERLDGSYDRYRDCDFCDTQEQAAAVAARWAARFGLPVVVVPLPSNVIPIRAFSRTVGKDPSFDPEAA